MASQQMSSQQVQAAPLTAERDAPQRPLQQMQPRQPERPAPQPVPDVVSAADILDAARQRVLPQQRIEPEVSTLPAQNIPAASRAAPVATEDGGPQSAAAVGIPFAELCETICRLAVERSAAKTR